MVLVARALAQGSTVLVLHEPCAGLDIGNQLRLIRVIRWSRCCSGTPTS
jgi:ABC-type cobalamin/Fe3+-siderophores transport system ATPase subunit